MPRRSEQRIVADGCSRARRAIEPVIRAQVESEFADRLREAGWLRRWLLRWEMACEIERRVGQKAPSDGLYAAARGRTGPDNPGS